MSVGEDILVLLLPPHKLLFAGLTPPVLISYRRTYAQHVMLSLELFGRSLLVV